MIKYIEQSRDVVPNPKMKFKHKQFWNIVLPLQKSEKSCIGYIANKLCILKYNADKSLNGNYKDIFYYYLEELNDTPENLKRQIQDWYDRQRC